MAAKRRPARRAQQSTRPRELFLSHSARDRTFTIGLANVLANHGVPSWYSEDFINAELWHDEIGAALARCDWFAVVLTPNAVKSRWVKDELLYALNDVRYVGRVVPLLVRDCDPIPLSWTLPNRQFIDFRSRFHDGCRDLLRRWGIGYRE